MMIPYSDFRRLLTDVSEFTGLEAYIAEVGGSVPMDDVEDTIHLLTIMWEMARDGLTIKSISAACDISVRQIALRYGLPTRTVENWAGGKTEPPVWQLPLIAYAVVSDYLDK